MVNVVSLTFGTLLSLYFISRVMANVPLPVVPAVPPTTSALQHAILPAHYQAMIWENDHIALPEIPSPEGYVWRTNDSSDEFSTWKPVMSTLPPAPDAVLHLVKCGCINTRCATKRCQCSWYIRALRNLGVMWPGHAPSWKQIIRGFCLGSPSE